MSLEALRKLAGGPKLEAARSVALFLQWCAQYRPPTRFTALEIDGVETQLYAPPEEEKVKGRGLVTCRDCGCVVEDQCAHCIFGSPCPRAGQKPAEERSRFSFVEVDNPVDHDAVADGVVMAFFALRGGHGVSVLTESNS